MKLSGETEPTIRRSGVPAERRKPLEIEECGFLPKAATLLLQRSPGEQQAVRFCIGPQTTARRAFSRVDLIVVIGVVVFLGLWFGFSRLGERGRIARCAGNLKVLGQAMQSYANDHDGGLPAAAIDLGNTKISWDMDLVPYLDPGLAKMKSVYDKKQGLQTIQPYFFCPSDPIQRKYPRSYAMSKNQMNRGNWPPRPDDETGIGLSWNKKTITLLDTDTAEAAMKNPELLPKLKLSLLPDPANTLLLTELIARNNIMGSLSSLRVGKVKTQQAIFGGHSSKFHFGKFNYLMADGHVELLTPLQTAQVGVKAAGIWTIKAGD